MKLKNLFEKMLQNRYDVKKSHDMKIQEVKKEILHGDDFFYTLKPIILPGNIY